MADQQPHDQPQPTPSPKPGQDWNEISVQEVEKTLTSAADLAYELAGDVGATAGQPKYRDNSGLESIETALDVELKQLEHLVDRTREQLSDDPSPAAAEPEKASAVPDFMSEFLSDEPVTVVPDSRALAEVHIEAAGSNVSSASHGPAVNTAAKPGLIGVGSLGRRESKTEAKQERSKPNDSEKSKPRASLPRLLEGGLYRICGGAVQLLEVADRPFAKLAPATRRALSVTAIAAFGVCLAMFLLSLLMS